MTDRPIIFSAAMVRALLDGHKTQTRRLLYSQRAVKAGRVPNSATVLFGHSPPLMLDYYHTLSGWQKVRPSDRLWVRETFRVQTTDHLCSIGVDYCADPGSPPVQSIRAHGRGSGGIDSPEYWDKRQGRNIPPIHMPRIFSRLTLVVTAVKIEPVQAIGLQDAKAEGCEIRQMWLYGLDQAGRDNVGRGQFGRLWSDLHGNESWLANPWVVALTFKVHRSNIDALKEAA